ncbi:hypothetical protein J7T55_014539 [Diaporthe amygdali]|uniref:uncharacterized protein n=1 Tax=Phomopsis amygdali TaxID=1214568 RepID=UPI0022FE6999|nr:uncharacterized protein J7T55_014539 [Diaporthe amygdali]KAJ0118086.1 hypothetical protein J7T55_014539 [Diaporthe amygdali]
MWPESPQGHSAGGRGAAARPARCWSAVSVKSCCGLVGQGDGKNSMVTRENARSSALFDICKEEMSMPRTRFQNAVAEARVQAQQAYLARAGAVCAQAGTPCRDNYQRFTATAALG